MRALAGVAAAGVLAGCGGSISCELSGLEVKLETGALCGQAEVSVLRARMMLSGAGVVPATDFERVYGGLPVRVADADDVGGHSGGQYFPAGWDEVGERIELTRHGWSLLHELLHAKEARAGVANAADPHAGWDAKGHRRLDDAFKADAPSMDR